ncbi:Hypothetical predicted protein [Prunus dulcis]|uniref:Uncharacterized protein n=1 Tax=Prunus dulcis TaxID=3755 RepID=A0A5E4FZD9_PRUDU|nr:Hypothetical predicted protein [Prunus dulcis]
MATAGDFPASSSVWLGHMRRPSFRGWQLLGIFPILRWRNSDGCGWRKPLGLEVQDPLSWWYAMSTSESARSNSIPLPPNPPPSDPPVPPNPSLCDPHLPPNLHMSDLPLPPKLSLCVLTIHVREVTVVKEVDHIFDDGD